MQTQVAVVPGLLTAQSPEGCSMEIGEVVASASRQTVIELVQAFFELRRMRESPYPEAHTANLPLGSDWSCIGYSRELKLMILNLRGVCWNPTYEQLENFVMNAALPFLGVETAQKLLPAGT